MAKGSVRKKGRKWYYRFYVEDESGRKIQKEFAGTESKAETETMLRNAMKSYEEKKMLLNPGNLTVGDLLKRWIEEEVKPGNLSNGTLMAYEGTIRRIRQFPISRRKLKTITPEHLQQFFDSLSLGETKDIRGHTQEAETDFTKPVSRGYLLQFSAVMNGAFRFAVYPGKMLSYNLMQYVKIRHRQDLAPLFPEENETSESAPVISEAQFTALSSYFSRQSNAALLPVQIAYFTGLRLGEVCALTWQDIDLEDQAITVRRSVRYNPVRHKTELGTTKRGKVRVVYFGDVLTGILWAAWAEQKCNRACMGSRYLTNYYVPVQEKGRTFYELYSLPDPEMVPTAFHTIDFVCVRYDGSLETPGTVSSACRLASHTVAGLEGFHFHQLRHTFTSNLLQHGASPKNVQELLGHGDIQTTMNIYAHADEEDKRSCTQLLDHMYEKPDILRIS